MRGGGLPTPMFPGKGLLWYPSKKNSVTLFKLDTFMFLVASKITSNNKVGFLYS